MKLIENFSVKNGRLTKEDNEIKFTKTEKKIIELLEKNDNQLTTKEELETNSKSYAYTINASSGSIIERHYKKK